MKNSIKKLYGRCLKTKRLNKKGLIETYCLRISRENNTLYRLIMLHKYFNGVATFVPKEDIIEINQFEPENLLTDDFDYTIKR